MKRYLVVFALVAGAFCLGATTRPFKKFPWAGDKLNEDCKRTMLEWNCLRRSINEKPEVIRLSPTWNITHLMAEPRASGFLVTVNLRLHPRSTLKFSDPHWNHKMKAAARGVLEKVAMKRFGALPKEFSDYAIRLHVSGRYMGLLNPEGYHPASKP